MATEKYYLYGLPYYWLKCFRPVTMTSPFHSQMRPSEPLQRGRLLDNSPRSRLRRGTFRVRECEHQRAGPQAAGVRRDRRAQRRAARYLPVPHH